VAQNYIFIAISFYRNIVCKNIVCDMGLRERDRKRSEGIERERPLFNLACKNVVHTLYFISLIIFIAFSTTTIFPSPPPPSCSNARKREMTSNIHLLNLLHKLPQLNFIGHWEN